MDLQKQIINLKTGKPYPRTLTIDERDENIKENGKFDITKVENETIGNVILHCLTSYPGDTKLDGFYANMFAQKIINGEKEIELNNKQTTYLKKILEENIAREKTNKKGETQIVGLYANWIICQLLQELGETFE